jgi:hypothetical protein
MSEMLSRAVFWEYILEVYRKGDDELADTLVLQNVDASFIARLTGLEVQDDQGDVYPLSEHQLTRLVPFLGTAVDTSLFDYYLTTRSPSHGG